MAAALLAGCGGSGAAKPRPSLVDSAPAVPWTSSLPAELQVPARAATARCSAADLRVQGPGLNLQPTVSGASGSVELRNVGQHACRLTGRPTVRFVGAARSPRQHDVAEAAIAPEFPSLSAPAASLEALAPGGSATVTIDWRNWCPTGRRTAAKIRPPRAARLTLPGAGGNIDVQYNAVTTCSQPGAASTIGVQPFQPALLPTSKPWSTVFLTARVLTLGGAPGPLHARPGAVLRYTVELRNASRQTLVFDHCPLFAQQLAPLGPVEAGMVNCSAAHPVKPGHTIRLTMRLSIPHDAPNGDNGLFWTLDPLGAQGPEATARVIITRRLGH